MKQDFYFKYIMYIHGVAYIGVCIDLKEFNKWLKKLNPNSSKGDAAMIEMIPKEEYYQQRQKIRDFYKTKKL